MAAGSGRGCGRARGRGAGAGHAGREPRGRPAPRPVAVSGMGGYVLTRGLPGGFLGDHGDVGNWHCPLGIAALSVESVIILLVLLAALGAWQARIHAPALTVQHRPAARPAPEYSQ